MSRAYIYMLFECSAHNFPCTKNTMASIAVNRCVEKRGHTNSLAILNLEGLICYLDFKTDAVFRHDRPKYALSVN